MKFRHSFAAAAAAVGALAASALLVQVRAGGDKVAFPENYAAGLLYNTVDRYDVKQYREQYATFAAVEAVRKGQPIPSGTVITMLDLSVATLLLLAAYFWRYCLSQIGTCRWLPLRASPVAKRSR